MSVFGNVLPSSDKVNAFVEGVAKAIKFELGEESKHLSAAARHRIGDDAMRFLGMDGVPESIENIQVALPTDSTPYLMAGVLFWFTRTGAGCGFWDGDYTVSDEHRLTACAKRIGHVDAYVGDDGKVHLL